MPHTHPWRRLAVAVVGFLLLVFGGAAHAGPPETTPAATSGGAPGPSEVPEVVAPDEPSAQPGAALLERAERIHALIDGSLDPQVDAASLFVLDLSDGVLVNDAEWLDALLQRVGEQAAEEAAPEPAPARVRPKPTPKPAEPAPEPDLDPAEVLRRAYVAFLTLPAERRATLLAAHAQRRADALAVRDAQARQQAEITRLEQQSEHLDAYLAGTLDVEIDPTSLLTLDLADLAEVGLASARRDHWTGASKRAPAIEAGSEAEPTPTAQTDPDAQRLTAARERLDGLRRRYLGLSADAKAQLRKTHRARIEAAAAPPEPEPESEPEESTIEAQTAQDISNAEQVAADAAEAQERALEAARQAKTEATRILKEEKARLLGIKGKQAQYEADLNRRRSERGDNHDKALEWSRRVAELEASPKFESEKALEADPMYDAIRDDLAAMRAQLRDELRRIREAGAEVPAAGEGLDRNLPADVDRGELVALRQELQTKHQELVELEQVVGWELARGLRDDLVLLNRTRLLLLDSASSGLRTSVTGFGPEGVDQAQRELDQISVELSFHLLKLARVRHDILAKLGGVTVPLLVGMVQFLLVLMAYLWWRKRAPELLSGLYVMLRDHRPRSRLHTTGSTAVWYLQRVRRPLELLLVLWVLFGQIGDLDDRPEFNLLWIIALWVLLGLAVILFVDALAAREEQFSASTQDSSALRIRSLRLVGLNVVAVGLILSLTSAMVGKGAIYSWVLSTCWLLSFPVAIHLVYKWRPIIFERIEQRVDKGAFATWVLSRDSGLVTYAAAAAGAAYLLGTGLSAWIMRQLSGLEATRRLLAYLFRREVAKQAAATEADSRYTPVGPEVYAVFDPETLAAEPLPIADAELAGVVKLALDPRPTLSVVVGERGAGKSMFLRRVVTEVGEDKVKVIACPEEGIDALLAEVAALTGQRQLRGPELVAALRELGPMVIAVDDLQRLFVPAVNGLQGLDHFTTFARSVGGEISWVMSIGSAAWNFVRRARGDHVFFEQVVVLPRWTEDDLGELIQRRCEQADITPSFDGLVVPRQAEAPLPNEGNRTEAGYYRLLWDFSRGNPAVALHAFRESLFINDEGETVVRLFKEPSHEQVESLPLSILFVLRATVQLESATAGEIAAATQIPLGDVEDALRFCLARSYIETTALGVRVGWPWYRTITSVLQRQHLLTAL